MEPDKKNPCVTITQAAKISGLSQHMVTYLGRTDLLQPTRRGRGRARLYSFNDVLFLKVIADLLSRGIEVKRLGDALRRARAESELWIDIRRAPRRYLVTDGTELFVRHLGQLESKTKNGQLAFAFVLDLRSTHQAVTGAWPRRQHSTEQRRGSVGRR